MKLKQIIKIAVAILFVSSQVQVFADEPQKLYNISEMPIVDMHTHLNGKEEFKYCVELMNDWGGAITITLNNNDPELFEFIEDSLDGRILMARRDYKVNFTPEDLEKFKEEGYCGIKTWLGYRKKASEVPKDQFPKMAELGLPYIGMHIADPPEDVYNDPENFMVYQQIAEKVIRENPDVNFIMAHGFYLTNRNDDIDTLRKFFDRNPNLYVDIVCTKWWDEPEPHYSKLRNLLIDYKDRFMFGSDFKVNRTSQGFKFVRERLETKKGLTFGNNGGPGPGLGLPLDVLNHIYYWNAAKIIPGLKEALEKLGYEISNEPPVSLAPYPEVNSSSIFKNVLEHENIAKIKNEFPILVNFADYGKSMEGQLEIRDYKKKNLIKILHKGVFEGDKVYNWDTKNDDGDLVPPGKYRVWFQLIGSKVAETVFDVE